MTEKQFPQNHPEMRRGEVFLGNFGQESFNRIGWKTKRRGMVAISNNGDPSKDPDISPVFVKASEMRRGGVI